MSRKSQAENIWRMGEKIIGCACQVLTLAISISSLVTQMDSA